MLLRNTIISLLLILISGQSQAAPLKMLNDLQPKIQAPKLQLLDGNKKITLDKYKGGYILVNFWATWCPTCIAEMSSLDALATKLSGKNLRVLAINMNEGGESEAQDFVSKLRLKKMTVLFDPEGSANKAYSILGLPTSYLISPEGILIAKLEGATKWDDPKVIDQIESFMTKAR